MFGKVTICDLQFLRALFWAPY